jgi:oxygen-independent coproporphyrinogen-3 oxidase
MAGIYLHIPFCKKLCNYCDFYHVISNEEHGEFIGALLKETELRKNYLDKNSVSTIYFGGGTPSVLSIKEIDEIFENLNKHFTVDPESEITIEMNPDDVTAEYLKGLKKIGFNRISLGIQS